MSKLVTYIEFTPEQREQLDKFDKLIADTELARKKFLDTLVFNTYKDYIGEPIYSSRDNTFSGNLGFVDFRARDDLGATVTFRTEDSQICFGPMLKDEFIEMKQRELERFQNGHQHYQAVSETLRQFSQKTLMPNLDSFDTAFEAATEPSPDDFQKRFTI